MVMHNPSAVPKPQAAKRNETWVHKGPGGFNSKTPIASSIPQVSRSAPQRMCPWMVVVWDRGCLAAPAAPVLGGCCCPRRGVFAGSGCLGITVALGTWVLGDRSPHRVLLARCLLTVRRQSPRGRRLGVGEAETDRLTAPGDGQMAGWRKQMCTRDGWMERLMDVLERGMHGETDRCTDGEQTPVPFPLALGMPGVLSCGSCPLRRIQWWDGGRGAPHVPCQDTPEQVAPAEPAVSALQPPRCTSQHTKPGSAQPRNTRQVVCRDSGEASTL